MAWQCGHLGRCALAGALLSLVACVVPPAAPPATSPPVPAPPLARQASAPASTLSPPAASAPASPTPLAERVRLRVPYVALSVTQLPAWVAQEAGLFAKQGLEVTLDYIRSSGGPAEWAWKIVNRTPLDPREAVDHSFVDRALVVLGRQ